MDWKLNYVCLSCPLASALCCDDKVHCCPDKYVCNVEKGKCDRKSKNLELDWLIESIPWQEKVKGFTIVKNVVCPDKLAECPTGIYNICVI